MVECFVGRNFVGVPEIAFAAGHGVSVRADYELKRCLTLVSFGRFDNPTHSRLADIDASGLFEMVAAQPRGAQRLCAAGFRLDDDEHRDNCRNC
jgi:hypothetical protein